MKVKDKTGNCSEIPGASANNWDREDEKMKKRIERSSINQVKYKYAQIRANDQV